MCDHLNEEKQSRDADTNNKEESVHESLVDVLMSFHMLHVIPHVVGLVVLCAQVPIHLSICQTHSFSDLYGNSL